MLRRIYLVMFTVSNAIVFGVLFAMLWLNTPAWFALAGGAIFALHGAQMFYSEFYGRPLIPGYPFGDTSGLPFALKLVAQLIVCVVLGFLIYLWVLSLLS